MNNVIDVDVKEIRQMERLLKNRSPGIHEMFSREADILYSAKDFEHDEIVNYKIRNLPYLLRGFRRIARDYGLPQGGIAGIIRPRGTLEMEVINKRTGRRKNYGLVSVNVVTDAFVNYLTDSLQDSTANPLDVFNWHASGTDNTAEAAGDTALGTEVGSRVQDGSPTEGGSANIYHTEAQLSYGSSLSIVEHGVFSANSAGTLLDRSIFAAESVDTDTEILFKYELTSTSGG